MLDPNRLNGDCGWIGVGFVEREATPEPAMRLGIQIHLARISLSDTGSILEESGVKRHRTTVQKGVKKADLQPASGVSPNHVALDETVIQLDDERYWLYAAVDPATNRLAPRATVSDENAGNYRDVSLRTSQRTSGG